MSVHTIVITASVAHRARNLTLTAAVASRVRTALIRTGPAGEGFDLSADQSPSGYWYFGQGANFFSGINVNGEVEALGFTGDGSNLVGLTPDALQGSTTLGRALLTAATASAARTELGAGATGGAVFTAATQAQALAALGEQRKIATSTTVNGTTYGDLTGAGGITLEANSYYRVEAFYYYTCTSSGGLSLALETTGSYIGTAAVGVAGIGQGASVFGVQNAYFESSTLMVFRGHAQAVAVTNAPNFSLGYFLTNSAGTAKFRLKANASEQNVTVLQGIFVITKL